jgi:hypothetical protein
MNSVNMTNRYNENLNFPSHAQELATQVFNLQPQRIQHILNLLKCEKNGCDIFSCLLHQVATAQDREQEDIDQKINQICEWIPVNETLNKVLKSDPLSFGLVVSRVKNVQCLLHLFSFLQNENLNWKELFVESLKKMGEKETSRQYLPYVNAFYKQVMESIPKSEKEVFLKICIESVEARALGILVKNLPPSYDFRIFAQEFAKYHHKTSFERSFEILIETIAGSSIPLSTQDQQITKFLLQELYSDKKIDSLSKRFSSFSLNTQSNLISPMSEILTGLESTDQMHATLAAEVLQEQTIQVLAPLLNHLALNETQYAKRNHLIQTFFNALENSQVNPLLTQLKEIQSPIAPYLLSGLPLSYFKDFICVTALDIRASLLQKSMIDEKFQVFLSHFNEEKRCHLVYEALFLKISNSLLGEGSKTFDMIYKEYFLPCLKKEVNCSSDQDVLAIYDELWQDIPPLMIALAAYKQEYCNMIYALIPFLTDMQLKAFVIASASKENVEKLIPYLSKVRRDQYKVIISSFSITQLKFYLQKEVDKLEQGLQLHDQQIASLEQKIKEALNQSREKEEYPSKHFDALQLQYVLQERGIQGILKSPEYGDLTRLLNQLENKDKTKLETVSNSFFNCLKSWKDKLEKLQKNELDTYLNEIERYVISSPDEDPLTAIDSNFWSILTQSNLSKLGLSSAKQLGEIGITSNQDLAYIAISSKEQILIDQIEMEVTTILQEESNQINLGKKWEEFLNLSLTYPFQEFFVAVHEMVEILQLKQIQPSILKKKMLTLLSQLLQLQGMGSRYCLELEQLQKQFQKEELDLISSSTEVMRRVFTVVKLKNNLHRLQNYINQSKDLAKTLKVLNSFGYHSISDLYNKNCIKDATDLYVLHELSERLRKREGEASLSVA